MATRIGTVREMVSRALCRLEQTGAVSRRDDRTLQVETRMLHAYLAADPASDNHLIAVH
jgi:predicted transcriptional regulator